MTALIWFRRDLRLADHPALNAAMAAHDLVVPVYCLDDRLLSGRNSSGARTRFLLECLQDLRGQLEERGSQLVIRRGRPEQVLIDLARETGAGEVHYTRDVSPFARSRGAAVRSALGAEGIAEYGHEGLFVIDDISAPRTKSGGAYKVFTPFFHTWSDVPRRAPLAAPKQVPTPTGLDAGELPSLAELGLTSEVTEPQPGGERAAARRLAWFLKGPIHRYADFHDIPGVDGTSKLSAYLHFGCLSPRAIEDALPEGEGPSAFRRQLCWRDFYHHLLLHNPENSHREYQEKYRGTLTWPGDDELFAAWCDGRTGFPLLDAGMRQLLREGWTHNRVRMLAGSFLTKQLGVDWRRGESWFMRLLLDGDQANNNGNWQWSASVGVDTAPYFRRMYNPSLHLTKYDPQGVYVREYVPELRGVPDQYLAEPWKMPDAVQRAAKCQIGIDYPSPVVDLAESRAEAMARYAGRPDH